jgi:hypothetical protein
VVATPERASDRTADEVRRLRLILRIIVIVVGAIEALTLRYYILSDGIQYLEIAQKITQGQWKSAVNAYWSPLYSWVLALAFTLFHPRPYFQLTLLHLTNLAAFVAGLAAFEYFVRQLLALRRETPGLSPAPDISEKSFLVLAYLLFLFGGVQLIRLAYPTPDTLAAFFVYLLQGMLISIVRRKIATPLWFFAAFGSALAFAFFAKAALSGLIPLYLFLAFIRIRPIPAALGRMAISGAALLLFTAPFLIALHQQKGYWTIGESGKLNYGWEVRGITRSTHWQGEPYTAGKPLHPTRKIFNSPDAYEFNGPLDAAYPPWFDPSYWYAGLAPGFSAADQWSASLKFSRYALALFLIMPGIAGYLILVIVQAVTRRHLPRPDVSFMSLTAPVLAGIFLYCLVFVEKRYIAAFLVVLCTTLLADFCVRHGLRRGPGRYLPHSAVATAAYALGPLIFYGFFVLLQEAVNRKEITVNENAMVAAEMSTLGISAGDKIAYIGLAIRADWVRVLGARVIAETTVKYEKQDDIAMTLRLNPVEIEKFWRLDPSQQNRVLQAFSKAGAKFVVADIVPPWASTAGWRRLQARLFHPLGTGYVYIKTLPEAPSPELAVR